MICKVTFLMSDMKIEVLALSWGGGGGGGEEVGAGFYACARTQASPGQGGLYKLVTLATLLFPR